MERPWFIGQPAPPNYVAGLGRGAMGFTTRSDIGPARNLVSDPSAAPSGPLGRGAGPSVLGKRPREEGEGDPEEQQGGEEADEFATGNNLEDEHLFASLPYEKDDEEADRVWDEIDERMDSKRRARREEAKRKELEEFRKKNPKIQSRFADIKPDLKEVSYDEWAAIPNPGDFGRAHRKQDRTGNSYTPVPDSILKGAIQAGQMNTSIDSGLRSGLSSFVPPSSSSSSSSPTDVLDLTQVSAARKSMLAAQLQMKSDSVSGQTNVDATGYLTDLNALNFGTADVGDIARLRVLFQSVTSSNPEEYQGWIAAARLEELDGKISAARKLLKKGCELCKDSPNVWLEAARLHPPDEAKVILANAVKELPKSSAIWIQAANLETNVENKKKVLRRALTFAPNSESLWKAAIELERPEDAKILLGRAVECLPNCIDMWIALANLESYESAKRVLNSAREKNPTELRIWICAAKLEEANSKIDRLDLLIKTAIEVLKNHQVNLSRSDWLEEAKRAEKSEAPHTCAAIVRTTIGQGLEDDEKKKTWLQDAENVLVQGHPHTARSILRHAVSLFPSKKSLWIDFALLEKNHGSRDSLDALLVQAVANCPKAEVLWLMAAKEKWLADDVDAARSILREAFIQNPLSERICLAAVKLEQKNNQPLRARAILGKARENAGTQKVWIKSIKLERQLGNVETERQIIQNALKIFPKNDKMWLLSAQLEAAVSSDEASRRIFRQALELCPHSANLWIHGSRLEEKVSAATARSFLDRARLKNPKSPRLWLEAIRVEQRAGATVAAQALLAKALQDCPDSGLLWAEAIRMEPHQKQRSKVVVALQHCDNDPTVIAAVARVFFNDGKVKKARAWITRSLSAGPDIGDTWALSYKLELQAGSPESQAQVLTRCATANPHKGELWSLVSKSRDTASLPIEERLKKVALLV